MKQFTIFHMISYEGQLPRMVINETQILFSLLSLSTLFFYIFKHEIDAMYYNTCAPNMMFSLHHMLLTCKLHRGIIIYDDV